MKNRDKNVANQLFFINLVLKFKIRLQCPFNIPLRMCRGKEKEAYRNATGTLLMINDHDINNYLNAFFSKTSCFDF